MITYLVTAVISLSSPPQITEITSVRVPSIEICHKMVDDYVTEALRVSNKITRTYLCVDRDGTGKGGDSHVAE